MLSRDRWRELITLASKIQRKKVTRAKIEKGKEKQTPGSSVSKSCMWSQWKVPQVKALKELFTKKRIKAWNHSYRSPELTKPLKQQSWAYTHTHTHGALSVRLFSKGSRAWDKSLFHSLHFIVLVYMHTFSYTGRCTQTNKQTNYRKPQWHTKKWNSDSLL